MVSLTGRDHSEEVRIKKTVDAWISRLSRDIQVSSSRLGTPSSFFLSASSSSSSKLHFENSDVAPSVLSLIRQHKRFFFFELFFFCSSPGAQRKSRRSKTGTDPFLPCHQAEMSSGNIRNHHSAVDADSSAHSGKERPVGALRGTGSMRTARRGSRGQRAGIRAVRLDSSGSH